MVSEIEAPEEVNRLKKIRNRRKQRAVRSQGTADDERRCNHRFPLVYRTSPGYQEPVAGERVSLCAGAAAVHLWNVHHGLCVWNDLSDELPQQREVEKVVELDVRFYGGVWIRGDRVFSGR